MSQNSNTKIPAAPPRNRPVAPEQPATLTEDEKQQKIAEIVSNAPLHTKTDESETKDDAKPWRKGMDLPVEALMQIRKKTSITQPTEHELRLAFLVNDKNSKRGFGPKFYINDLIIEAVEQYTKAELKKLGYDTK